MPKLVVTSYICQQCGFRSSQYLGKCPQCDSWNSFVEQVEEVNKDKKNLTLASYKIINLADLKQNQDQLNRISSQLIEFDRVVGGGIVPGSLILVSGDPGVGKSTILTQLALNIKATGGRVQAKNNSTVAYSLTPEALYVAGEESAQQIKIRVDRLEKGVNLSVLNEVDVDLIIKAIEDSKPGIVIVDSVQTLETSDLNAAAGSISQVRECAHRLQKLAKKLHIPIFLVGHVTKEGVVAGPKTLEHLVDVVLSLEGDPSSPFRVLRANKNRFGPTDEVGIFEMVENGMMEVTNPSKLFLQQRISAPGSIVVATLTGLRPILVEIQALVTKSNLVMPRRASTGIDNQRLQLLVAVLQKRLGLSLFDQDVFINVTGGLKLLEPAVDLGICMAIVSSFKDKPINSKIAFVGEIGLLGEIRIVKGLLKRIKEAKKLGFTRVISSENARTLVEAVKLC